MATPRHAWQRPRPPRHASQRPRHALQRPRPPLASQLIRQQVGGVFFDVELLGPCEKACRGGRGRCEACLGGRGRCQACLGVAKQAYTS